MRWKVTSDYILKMPGTCVRNLTTHLFGSSQTSKAQYFICLIYLRLAFVYDLLACVCMCSPQMIYIKFPASKIKELKYCMLSTHKQQRNHSKALKTEKASKV